jgi:4-hydroxy 2-oxovalerate aldolase
LTLDVRVTDSTLRDGSHTVGHRFTVDHVREIVELLAAAGMPVIEVSHGDGLGGSTFNYGFSTTDEFALIETATETAAGRSIIGVLLIPGIGLAADLRTVAELSVGLVRVATHCTEADIAAQHITTARELGLEVNGFLMMSHMLEPAALAIQAALMESYGAHAVYVVDSAGALVPMGARERVQALWETLGHETRVGFHAHDNLGCALGNTLAAIEVGAALVDGSLGGLGAGAGNAACELVAAAAERSGYITGLDPLALGRAAQRVELMLDVHPRRDLDSLLLGYAGVYSSFLLHARRASEQFGVTTEQILIKLGRRGMVSGQEDMIVDAAADLANRSGMQPPAG